MYFPQKATKWEGKKEEPMHIVLKKQRNGKEKKEEQERRGRTLHIVFKKQKNGNCIVRQIISIHWDGVFQWYLDNFIQSKIKGILS